MADITTAPILKRQTAFAVIAAVPAEQIPGLVQSLAGDHPDLASAIRNRQARDLLRAAFGQQVPTGYIRALARIGAEPLRDPQHYARLLQIYRDPLEAAKAHALRYCGALDATKIEVVDALDPAILHPQIVAKTSSVARAHQINATFRLLREICSTVSDADIVQSFISTPKGIDAAAQRWIERADRFPEPPFRDVPGLTPLSSAAAMVRTAAEMRNCLKTKIPEVVLGYSYYYRAQVEIPSSGLTPVVVEILPLSGGFWRVAGVHGPRHRSVPPKAEHAVIRPLLERGALISTTTRPDASALGHGLTGYRWDTYYLPEEEEAEDEVTEDAFA